MPNKILSILIKAYATKTQLAEEERKSLTSYQLGATKQELDYFTKLTNVFFNY